MFSDKLLGTALCSQALPAGLYLLVGAAVANAFGGGPQNDVRENLGLVLILGNTLLLGLYVRPDWRGIGISLLGLLGEVGGFLFPGPFPLSPNFISEGLSYVPLGIGGIVIMQWVAGKIKSTRELIGMVLAILIGISMSIGLAVMIAKTPALNANYLKGGGVESLHFFLPILWTWLSAVFFPEFLSRRTDWRGLLIWVAAMLIFTIVIFGVLVGLGVF